jgi:DNA primase
MALGEVAQPQETPVPSPHADHVIAAIKNAVPIVDLIGEQVALTRRGRVFKGLCPFHPDKNPSLNVDPERSSYKCWSCNAGGDIFDFVMNRERIDFREALKLLAQRARIELPERNRSSESDRDKKQLFEINKWAEDEFHRCFKESPLGASARDFAAKRGLSDDSIQQFGLGFAPREWEWLIERARQRRITPETLERCGLAVRRQRGPGCYDRFRGRLMFPIRDARGRTIAFGGRIMPEFESADEAKFVNSAESPIFIKSEHLFGLDRARDAIIQSRCAVVVEGYNDCIIAHQHGLKTVVATLGTALGERHVAILKRYADRIVLVFDGDDAGQKAADRVLELFLSQEADLRIYFPPDGLDPDDFLIARGADEFRAGLDSAMDALDFKLRRAAQQHDLTSLAGRRKALDYVLSTIAALPVVATGTAPVTREMVLDKLGQRLSVPLEVVRRRLRELREQIAKRRSNASTAVTVASEPNPLWAGETPIERELFEILLADLGRADEISATVKPDDIKTPGLRRILEACIELRRDVQALHLDALRLRLEDRELACRASILAETGREKGELDRRLQDVLAHFASRRGQADIGDEANRGDRPASDPASFLAQKYQRALSRQRRAQRHALSDSP